MLDFNQFDEPEPFKNMSKEEWAKIVKEIELEDVYHGAEQATLDTSTFRAYYIARGLGWILKIAEEEIYGSTADRSDLEPQMLGLDASEAFTCLEILEWLHQENGTAPFGA